MYQVISVRVLTVRPHEKIMIGDNIEVKYVEWLDGRIRLGISAPASVPVLREKVFREMQTKGASGAGFGGEARCQDDVQAISESDKAPPAAPGPTGSTAAD